MRYAMTKISAGPFFAILCSRWLHDWDKFILDVAPNLLIWFGACEILRLNKP